MHRRALGLVTSLLLIALVSPTSQVQAEVKEPRDIRLHNHEPDLNFGHPLPIKGSFRAQGASASATRLRVGTRKLWLALDDVRGELYLKRYKLRGKGRHIEVWIANDEDEVSRNLRFPEGDCRNDERVRITNRQVNYLIREFDKNMYPKETKWFSKPPDRNGANALLNDRDVVQPPFPKRYFRGDGDDTVVLIDNVRDEHFYDEDNSQRHSYTAGFFASLFNELADRNIMTIDSFDWVHRTTANPPHEPVPGDNCASKPARPYLYEQVFAHEYQHLLEYYEDPDEELWVNEGLSDWAMTLTGYASPQKPITDVGFGSHIQCFLGWLEVQTDANPNPTDGGPENSLNIWDEQEDEVLCDYGASHSFMEMLRSRYGREFMRRLHRQNAGGFDGIARALAGAGSDQSAQHLVHDWSAMASLDAAFDAGADLVAGSAGDAGSLSTQRLNASINWTNDDTHSEAGAPPNGSDFVRLRDSSGQFLTSDQIDSISFDGADTLPSEPVQWSIDSNPAGHSNNTALRSGTGTDLDRAIIREVSVPNQNATLTFENRYEIEEGWDFGFVQVSTDGGSTWRSLSNSHTTSQHDPDAFDRIVDELPGFTGNSGCPSGSQFDQSCSPSWVTETFDLSEYANRSVLLGFRYMTDIAVDLPGWWIDDVRVGNALVSDGSTLSDWRSGSQARPTPISGFTVQLVSHDEGNAEAGRWILLDNGNSFERTRDDLALPTGHEVVAALVMYDEPSESIRTYAPYELRVNGVLQPGG